MTQRAVEMAAGPAAFRLLHDQGFFARWHELLDRCPWGTSLQSPQYVSIWFDHYKDRYSPLLVYGDSGCALAGLVALAVEEDTGRLVFAGDHQAEYHAWLAVEDNGAFISQALDLLSRMGHALLSFRYAPTATPIAHLEGGRSWRASIRPARKPVMRIDPENILDSLKKKGNRSKINRLERVGKLEFRRLCDPADLDDCAEDLMAFTDLRQGAINGVLPFRQDERKYCFYRALLAEGVCHATITRAGSHLVAIHLGLRNGCQMILGIIAHSPFVAEHSPGKFHILQLGLMLADQGVTELDLTPGGDAYKERFATGAEEVYLIDVYLSQKQWIRTSARQLVLSTARRFLPGRSRQAARAVAHRLGRLRRSPGRALRTAARLGVQRLWSRTELRVYRMQASAAPIAQCEEFARRNHVPDLLRFSGWGDEDMPMQTFLSGAMARLESGSTVYTRVEDDRLVHCGWVSVGSRKSFLTEVQQEYALPPGSASLWDYHTHATYRGRGFYSRSLRQMIRMQPLPTVWNTSTSLFLVTTGRVVR